MREQLRWYKFKGMYASLQTMVAWWWKKVFIINNVIVDEDVAHLREWSTCLSMFAPTTRNGSTMEPKYFHTSENIFHQWKKYLVTQKIIYEQRDHVATATWSCWVEIEGHDFGRLRPKRTLYISKQYHQGRNFLTPKTPLGGGLKNVKGTGNIF